MELEQTKSLGKVKPKVDPSIDRYLEMRKNLSNPLGPVLETVVELNLCFRLSTFNVNDYYIRVCIVYTYETEARVRTKKSQNKCFSRLQTQIYVSDTQTTFSKFAQLSMTHSCCIG